jgi:hypothetical protein
VSGGQGHGALLNISAATILGREHMTPRLKSGVEDYASDTTRRAGTTMHRCAEAPMLRRSADAAPMLRRTQYIGTDYLVCLSQL